MGARAVFLVCISIILLLSDYRYNSLGYVRAALSVLIIPVQYSVNLPVRCITWVGDAIVSKKQLLQENSKLQADLLSLQVQNQRLSFLERDNVELHKLLDVSKQFPPKAIMAQILAVNTDNASRQVVLNRGGRDYVSVGQPVLDAYGVIGQVITVDWLTSRMLSIMDTKSAIPVISVRNGLQGIVVGLGNQDTLGLLHIPSTADIQRGDLLVTSGLGSRFPAGYPVGVVASVVRGFGEKFIKVSVLPSAKVSSSRYLLLVQPVK